MSPHFVTISVFAAVSVGTLGVVSLIWEMFWGRQSRLHARVKAEFFDKVHERAKQSILFHGLGDSDSDDAAAKATITQRLQTFIAQSGLNVEISHLALASIGLCLSCGFSMWFSTYSALATIPLAIMGAVIPWFVIHLARQRRMRALCRQLPEAFDVMARALRAGQTVQTSFQAVAKQFPSPIAEEFAYCFEQQHLGVSYEVTLQDLARRTGYTETQLFATALIINRQAGGNLAGVLGKLADTMRKRARFQGKVRALTGEGRMQAIVLIALPIVALLTLFLLNRDYAQTLLDRPELLGAMGVSQALGAFFIRRIIDLKY